MIWAFIASICWAIWAVFERKVSQHISLGTAIVVSFVVYLPFEIWYARQINWNDFKSAGVLYALGGSLAAMAASIAYIKAYQSVPDRPISIAAVGAMYPVFAAIIFWALGDTMTIKTILGVAFGLIACLLLSM